MAYVVLSVATFPNMYVVLTTLYPDNPAIADWLGIGPAIRSEAGVVLFSRPARGRLRVGLRPAAGRARTSASSDELAAASLDDAAPDGGRAATPAAPAGARPSARSRPSSRPSVPTDRPRRRRDRPPPVVAAGAATACAAVALPTWTDPADVRRGRRPRLVPRPARRRADPARPSATLRSARAAAGSTGSTCGCSSCSSSRRSVLRTFRLAEPYQMHFDEVYHARTATEFLQGWRYGLSHDIYEWTHPHLAKYAMAGGLVLWGEDDVSATSELGRARPRRGRRAAARGRRCPATGPASGCTSRPGPRSGPTTCARASSIAVMARARRDALAIDDAGEQLVVGSDDGRLGDRRPRRSSALGGVDAA